jgi:hypothetical protein
MSATANQGAKYGQASDLLRIHQVIAKASSLIGEPSRVGQLENLFLANDAFSQGVPFTVTINRPKNVADFLRLNLATRGLFNQFVSEVPSQILLDQVEEVAVSEGVPDSIRPFLHELWADEAGKLSRGWTPSVPARYPSVEEAIKAYKQMFGSSLQAEDTLRRAKAAIPNSDTEGIAVWVKISTLGKLFGSVANPLDTTEVSRQAYFWILQHFTQELGKCSRTTGDFFNNVFSTERRTRNTQLTPAGIATWRQLENTTSDDFCFSPAGASTGSQDLLASGRRARIVLALDPDRWPQDCIMVGQSLAIQPERLTNRCLKIACVGNVCYDEAYQHPCCFYWDFNQNLSLWLVGIEGVPDQYDATAIVSMK